VVTRASYQSDIHGHTCKLFCQLSSGVKLNKSRYSTFEKAFSPLIVQPYKEVGFQVNIIFVKNNVISINPVNFLSSLNLFSGKIKKII